MMNKSNIKNANSMDIMCATDVEEFYYEGTDEPVPEGEPIGVDIEAKDEVELVLFSNIYWSPSVDE